MNDLPWSIWLMPARVDLKKYEMIITLLSERYESKIFTPHLTLLGRLKTDPKIYFGFFEDLVKKYSKFNLISIGIETAEPPWKSLFIKFKTNNQLNLFQSIINNRFKELRNYEFQPHLSLAYGEMKHNDYLDVELFKRRRLVFSSIALVYTPSEVEKWELIKKFKLN